MPALSLEASGGRFDPLMSRSWFRRRYLVRPPAIGTKSSGPLPFSYLSARSRRSCLSCRSCFSYLSSRSWRSCSFSLLPVVYLERMIFRLLLMAIEPFVLALFSAYGSLIIVIEGITDFSRETEPSVSLSRPRRSALRVCGISSRLESYPRSLRLSLGLAGLDAADC